MHPAARPHSALVGLLAAASAWLWRPSRRTGRRCALTCEAFDAVKCVSAAAGIRILIKSPLKAITLRDAISSSSSRWCSFLWDRLLGASFTVSYGFGTVLDRMAQPGNLECGNDRRPGAGISAGCAPSVRQTPESRPPTRAGSGSRRCVRWRWDLRIRYARGSQHFARSFIYDSSAHLGGAPLRPWWNQRLDVDHYVPGDLGNHARARPVPGPNPAENATALQHSSR